MSKKSVFFREHCQQFRRPTILQLNIEGTVSKMNIFHYLALQFEALVILLQETHCNNAENLVLTSYQLAGSSSNRKRSLATFVHERLWYTLLEQSPPTPEIKLLFVDVDGYKIVYVYNTLSTRLRSLNLPVFSHSWLYAKVSIFATFIGVTMITVLMVSAWLLGKYL